MTEDINSITYDENWQSISDLEYPQIIGDEKNYADDEYAEHKSDDNRDNQKQPKTAPSQLLITIQLILCILIAIMAFVLKSMGGDAYTAIREWYSSNLNNSAIFDGKSSFDLSTLFGQATSDEV